MKDTVKATKREVKEVKKVIENVEVKENNEVKIVNDGSYEPTANFVYMDKVSNILDVSLATNKNCILFGKGGYGKSEFTYSYFREKGIDPYVITMGSGMTTDRLFGGVDLMGFNETGKIEYLIENSFMNHEFVIFEELFDAPDFILEQLKDILSSGIFRNGNQIFKIKTRNIICCTNKSREEFAKNLSLKALMERFPLELDVKWENHNRLTYQHLFESKFGKGNADPFLTYVLEEFAKKNFTISPRIALVAASVMDQCGPDCLEYIADFSAHADILKDSKAKFKSIADISEKIKLIEGIISEIGDLIKKGLKNEAQCKVAENLNTKLTKEIKALSSIKADDSLAVSTATKVKDFTTSSEKLTKVIALSKTMTEEFINSL